MTLSFKTPAMEIVEFIEGLTVPSGMLAGRPVCLLPFQCTIIEALYGDSRPRQAVISLPRKNGKTTLAAGIILAHLVGPQQEPSGEIYSAAADRDQASLTYRIILDFLRAQPKLAKGLVVRRSERSIEHPKSGTVYRALSSDAHTKHGLNPSLIMADELAQWPDSDLWDVLATSQGARANPLLCAISTQAPYDDHILSQLIDYGLSKKGAADPNFYCYVRTGGEGATWGDPKQWEKANPALGVFRSQGEMEVAYRQACAMPYREPAFRNLYLNQRIAQQEVLVSPLAWNKQRRKTPKTGGQAIIGLVADDWNDCALGVWYPDDDYIMGSRLQSREAAWGVIRRYSRRDKLQCLTVPADHYDEMTEEFPGVAMTVYRWADLVAGARHLRELVRFSKLKHGGEPLDKALSRITLVANERGQRSPQWHPEHWGDVGPLLGVLAALSQVPQQAPTLEVIG